jgi:ATP-dependent Zn protease
MVVYYGMGKKVIYPNKSDKFKEIIDTEVQTLINEAYDYAEYIVSNTREFILESAEILKAQKVLRAETLTDLIEKKYPEINYLNNK